MYSNSLVSAITIASDNVLLDFNQRKIQTAVASTTAPLIVANTVTDLVLNNIHLEAVGPAKFQRGGILVSNSFDVEIHSPVLLNFAGLLSNTALNALSVITVKGLNVTNLYLKNDDDSTQLTGILFGAVSNFTFTDSSIFNARVFVDNSQNGDLLRLKIDNTGAAGSIRGIQVVTNVDASYFQQKVTDNIRIEDSNIKIKNAAIGILVASLSTPFNGNFITRNVTIQNNVVSSITHTFYSILLQRVEGAVIHNNAIASSTAGNYVGIFLISSNGATVSNNNIRIRKDTIPGFVGGIFIERFAVVPVLTVGNFVRENNVVKTGLYSADRVDIGIGAGNPSLVDLKYNTFDRNNVSGFYYGVVDNIPGEGYAECTIFSENFSNGNVVNYSVTTAPPNNSIFLANNVDGCKAPVPPAPPVPPAALLETFEQDTFPMRELELE